MAVKPTWLGWKEIIVVTLFLIVLLLPLIFEGEASVGAHSGRQLVIVTPHNEQIRSEFEHGFEKWHQRVYDEPVDVVWSVPGGTSEIRRMLLAQWSAALEQGHQPGGDADLVFGGGSYEHSKLKSGATQRMHNMSRTDLELWLRRIGVEDVNAAIEAKQVDVGIVHVELETDGGAWTINAAAAISDVPPMDLSQLPALYGRESVAGTNLWDPDHRWFGTALSSFGIIANSDELAARGLDVPDSWVDLADPRLDSAVSMVNPAQSGSVTTAFETILKRLGWSKGWQILRRAAANARTFSASSLRGPTDVASGDAAMGVCIDFFGRYQQQALADHGAPGRLIYVDPQGETTLDPDPISMLANPPDPELAARFIEFTLSENGQALWQFAPADRKPGELGPRRFALRRLPVRDSMYREHFEHFVDQVDPFANAAIPEHQDRAMRAFIAPLMQAMAMDERTKLRAAWGAIVSHPSYPKDFAGIVSADDVDDAELATMLEHFDAMPDITDPDGRVWSLNTPEGRDAVKRGWLRGGWSGSGLWDERSEPSPAFRRHAGGFFRNQFDQVVVGSSAQ
ncbi:MAG: extracellular solute-binding protein [Phycisphaerales bacterium]|nr:extracellular solute-binding protein [Phycisphaerales bacterium]